MMMDWADEPLHRLAEQADLVVWGYRGRPETNTHHHHQALLDRFAQLKLPLWGAGAFKGADGHFAPLPDYDARLDNAIGWANAACRYDFRGIIATGWSRYAAAMPQVEPLDATLDCLAAWALLSHDGPDAKASQSDAISLLPDEARVRFEQFRSALGDFADTLSECWRLGMVTSHSISSATTDPTRKPAEEMKHPLDLMADSLAQLQATSETVADLLTASHERFWAEQFVQTRMHAARSFHDSLHQAMDRLLKDAK